MAAFTSAAVTVPSFAGLKATTARRSTLPVIGAAAASSSFSVKASLREAAAVATVAIATSTLLAGSAMAASYEVLLGSSDGGLAFVPNDLSIAPGDELVFKNNAGFPHNVVFDEDEIPSGVDVASISMSDEDLLNAPGETYKVTLKEKGTYSFYCSPHQGAGMVGKVTVN